MTTFLRFAAGFFLFSVLAFTGPPSFATNYYQWKDDEGTVHFSDSLEAVPPEYRDQVGTRDYGSTKEERDQPERALPPDPESEPVPEAVKPARKRRYEVPYVATDAQGAQRIIIPVTFNQTVTASMALDTGAPGLLISPALAERIGLFDADEGKLMVMAGGIGGGVPAVRTIIDSVQVGKAGGEFVPTTVTPSISDSFEGLVGMDFLGPYSVFIDTQRHVVVFEERPEASGWPGGHDEAWWRATFREFTAYQSGWEDFRDRTDREIRDGSMAVGTRMDELEQFKDFAETQLAEAERLMDKLDIYASENAVPVEWR